MQADPPKTESETLPTSERKSRREFRGRFLILSILFHILLAAVATYLVVQTFTPRKQMFRGEPPAKTNREVEHKIDMVKRKNTMSAPVQTKRITSTALSQVALPEMPVISSEAPTELSSMSGVGGPGAAFAGAGAPGAGAAGSAVPLFGLRDSHVGLKGTFYDLKQTRSGQSTRMNPNAFTDEVRRFVTGGWNQSRFARYFKAPDPLYAPQIMIPQMDAAEGPKAFDLADKVQPKMWLVVYEGFVTPPKSGRYRFVGKGDDIMIVRFNKDVVLDWSQPDAGKLSNWKPRNKAYMYDEGSRFGFMPGDWFNASAGTAYPIEILIGERPGGGFMAGLMIERMGEQYKKDNHGNPILPLFRLAGSPTPKLINKAPVFDPTGAPWRRMDPPQAQGSGLLP
jgi:hypothetical protein